jgi:hypothetical protein
MFHKLSVISDSIWDVFQSTEQYVIKTHIVALATVPLFNTTIKRLAPMLPKAQMCHPLMINSYNFLSHTYVVSTSFLCTPGGSFSTKLRLARHT